jgi:hypothetical protein
MIKTIKMLDQTIPLWEILVIGLALLAIVAVLVLWWAFGYNLTVVTPEPATMKPVVFAGSLI